MSANGSNNFLNIEDANLRVRSGSVHAQGMTIGGITVGTAHGLQSVTDTSNTTSNTLQFTNATTAFKATSNIELTSATKIIVDSNVVTEYTGLATTLKSVYDVPATTGTQLEVYYDGRETLSYPESGGATVYDISPNTNNGTLNGGVGFDPTYKAFTFDGSSSQNITSSALGFTGDQPHTFSFWIKDNEMNHVDTYVMHIGRTTHTASQNSSIEFRSDRIRWASYANDIEYPLTGITSNTWYHIIGSYAGGGATPENKSLYINGKRFDDTGYNVFLGWEATAGDALGFQSDAFVTLGSSTAIGTTHFNGSIANFRLYSKALNADQVKELYDYQKDYFLGSKSQLTIYKGHLGVGVTEPSGQLELAGDERLQEYPPRALRQYTTHVEGHGVFTVRASAELNQTGDNDRAWKLFTKIADNSNYWTPTGGTTTYGYSSSDGYTTAYHETAGVQGHWVQLQLPYKIKLHSVKIAAGISTRQAKDATVFGSNDGGNTWTSVGGWTDNNVDDYSLVTFSMNNVGYYSLYRLVITRNGGNEATTLSELQFFGTPGPTTLDKGSLSLTRSLDVPRVSRYDVDTETPRPEKLLVDFDTTVNSSPTDISGKGNHGTFGGDAYYSSADKAFILANNPAAASSASTHYIRAELNNSETGNQYHSVSLWFKVLSGQNSSWRTIFECGENPRSGNSDIGLYVQGGNDKLVFAHGGTSMYSDTLTNLYFQWHHVVLTYDGANRKMYLDGTLIKTQATTTWTGVANMTLHFGRNNHSNANEGCDCHVSNFKLYWKTALEPSEVRKLYRLGRTGRSMVISDTAVGIGKVPEAQLDVRGTGKFAGDLYLNEPPVLPQVIGFHAYASTRTTLSGNSSITDHFDLTYYNYNSCYNTSTGIFTAPFGGLYGVELQLRSLSTYYCVFIELRDASGSLRRHVINQCEEDVTTNNEHRNMAGFTWMDAGDTLKIKTSSGSGSMYVDTGSWSKYVAVLIHKTP